MKEMQRINLFDIRESDLELLKTTFAASRSKNHQRQFAWSASILDEFIDCVVRINNSATKNEKAAASKFFDVLGDTYYAVKRHDAAFACYAKSFTLGASSASKKLALMSNHSGHNLNNENATAGFIFLAANRIICTNAALIANIESSFTSTSTELRLYIDIFITNCMIGEDLFNKFINSEHKISAAIDNYGAEVFMSARKRLLSGRTPKILADDYKNRFQELHAKQIAPDLIHEINAAIYDERGPSDTAHHLPRYKCAEAKFWSQISPSILHRTLSENLNFKISMLNFAARLRGHPTLVNNFKSQINNDWGSLEVLDGDKYKFIFERDLNREGAKRVFRQLPSI